MRHIIIKPQMDGVIKAVPAYVWSAITVFYKEYAVIA